MEPRSRTDRPSGAFAEPEKRSSDAKPAKRGKRARKQARRAARDAARQPAPPQAAGQNAAGIGRHGAERRQDPPGVVEIIVIDRRWRRLVPHIERLVRQAAIAGGGAGSVVLDNDLRIRLLNARHRGKNKPTNVLTFENPPGIPGGDIVVALETVRREAIAAGRRPRHHLAHLVVHGALHLRGHDHHRVGDARRMEMQEARILHRLGVPNPWKPRMAEPAR